MPPSSLFLFKFSDAIFILLSAVNTLLNIDAIGSTFTTEQLKYSFPAGSLNEDSEIAFSTRTILENDQSGNYQALTSETYDCGDGLKLPQVTGKCPHRQLPIQIALMVVFGVYFLVVIAVRQYYSSQFASNDFRYHFYIDQWNATKTSRLLFVGGMLITFAVCIIGFVEVSNEGYGVGEAWAVIMFFVTNFLGTFFKPLYVKNMDYEVWENILSEEIPISELPAGEGWIHALKLAFGKKDFFLALQASMTDTICGRKNFERITTNPDGLMKMMVLLSLSEEDDIKAFYEKEKKGEITIKKEGLKVESMMNKKNDSDEKEMANVKPSNAPDKQGA